MKQTIFGGILGILLISGGCVFADTQTKSQETGLKDDPYALMELFGVVYQEIKTNGQKVS